MTDTSKMSETAGAELAKLREECRQLEAQLDTQGWELNLLRARFARYETALRGSRVTVYTQDRNLRFTSINNSMFGREIAEIVGRTDEEVFPADGRAAIVALKQDALASGQPKHAEIAIQDGTAVRWHDLHVEPMRSEGGDVVGLTCAAVDVTERKEGEAHLRLLMRELTHRSKNLLAVIQAMARQTARHAGSIDAFLRQFGARLQALAASHDLLVRESWYGASLNELIRSQLALYTDPGGRQVSIDGPDVALKPEAAQNLGLAFHELVINAAKFGSLSVPEGRVLVSWAPREDEIGSNSIVLDWREQFGPKVKPRRKRGFGSLVIEKNLARATDAEVRMDFDPEGLHCQILLPGTQILGAR